MRKCKICGEPFQYHVTTAHIESHGITREEYKRIKEKEFKFDCAASAGQKEAEINSYVVDSCLKMRKKYDNK